jgi:hypothetical protein
MDRTVVAEADGAFLEVLDEAFLFRDGVEFFGPGFEVGDTAGELDADLTWFGAGHGVVSLGRNRVVNRPLR